KKIFWIVVVLLFLLAMSYAFFVNKTILNIVERENLEEKIVVLNSQISELESDCMTLKNNITIDYAYLSGFYDVNNIKFASRKLPSQGISLRKD
ncbi:hypothetical protein KKC45_01185, partial [Patescibacteria group bacterium]|nr:hypothetical protein [Patescibacteria group bacterium]